MTIFCEIITVHIGSKFLDSTHTILQQQQQSYCLCHLHTGQLKHHHTSLPLLSSQNQSIINGSGRSLSHQPPCTEVRIYFPYPFSTAAILRVPWFYHKSNGSKNSMLALRSSSVQTAKFGLRASRYCHYYKRFARIH